MGRLKTLPEEDTSVDPSPPSPLPGRLTSWTWGLPIPSIDKERWQLQERDGQYLLVKREAETPLDELVELDDLLEDDQCPTTIHGPVLASGF